jgi:hypothetical protein
MPIRSLRRTALASIITARVLTLLAAPAYAVSPGDFDPTFGGGAEAIAFDVLFGGHD